MMLPRLIICGVAFYLAVVVETGLPTWITSPALPSTLALLLVLFCQALRGGELVFWGGLIGLAQDDFNGIAPGPGMMTAATVALYFARREINSQFSLLSDRLLGGFGILMFLGLVRGGRTYWGQYEGPLSVLTSTILIQITTTYLVFVCLNLLYTGWQYCTRRTYRLENTPV